MGLEIGAGTAGNAALRIRYAKALKDVTEQVEKSKVTPFWSQLTKSQGRMVSAAFGQAFYVPIRSQTQQTVSADYATSYNKANGSTTGSSSQYDAFTIPVATKYGHARISGLANLQSETAAQAFVKLGAKELDGAIQATIRQIASLASGSGYGDLGRIGAVHHTADYVDLTIAAQAANFRKGMDLVAAAARATGGLRSATALTVTSVSVGSLTSRLFLSGDPTALSWSAGSGGDYLFVNGDRPNTPAAVNHMGLDFWIPTTLPAVGSGVDASGAERSSVELAGHRFDGNGGSIVDVLIDAAAFAAVNSIMPDMLIGNPLDVAKVVKAQEAKRHVQLRGKSVDVGFEAPSIQTGALGELPFLGDRTVPQGRFYFVDSSSWHLLYAGPDIVHPVGMEEGGDGLIFRKVADADAWLAACRSASNIACDAPLNNMVVTNYA